MLYALGRKKDYQNRHHGINIAVGHEFSISDDRHDISGSGLANSHPMLPSRNQDQELRHILMPSVVAGADATNSEHGGQMLLEMSACENNSGQLDLRLEYPIAANSS